MSRSPLGDVARCLKIATDPALAAAPDGQLLANYRSTADQNAFAELVRRHERAVLAACRQVLSDAADIEDAFQATFLVLVRQAKRVRCDASLGGWLFAVAHRVAVRAARTRARKSRCESNAPTPAAAPETGADLSWREAVAALHEELDALPDRFRLPLILCYLDGLSRDEAATKLGWKPGSVKAGLERGRERLRLRLQRRGVTLSAGLLGALAGLGSVARASPNLLAATLRVAEGGASSTVLELARPAMTTLTTKAKFLLGAAVAASLGVGLFAAGTTRPPADPPQAATAKADAKQTAPKPAVVAPDQIGAGEPGLVAGRVVGPDGKPVANATLTWRQKPSHDRGLLRADPTEYYAAPVTGKTDADGRFKLNVVIRGRTPFRVFNPWGNLTVQADGFGAAASHTGNLFDDKWNQNIELKLVKADVPIEGQLVDLEGKPVAGVTVRPVVMFFNIAGDLGPWIKAVTGSGDEPDRHQVGIAIPADDLKLTQSATTDADGRFKLTGLGNERVVGLRLDGAGIESHYVQVMTRPGEKFTITNQRVWHPSTGPRDVYPAKFTHAVAPGGTVTGTITAGDTGKPLAGVRVTSAAWVEGSTIPPIRRAVVTDKDGKYTLTGYPRQSPYMLRVEPPADQPYVAFLADVPGSNDGKPRTVNVTLPRGVFVSGTVTDKVRGKPLAAVVQYYAHSANPNLGGKYPVDQPVACNPKDGSFKLVALPGDGVIAAKISDPCRGAYISGVGAETVSWFDKTKNSFDTPSLGFSARHYDAFAGIAPKPGAEPMTVDLKLDPGVVASVRFVDPDGKPLSGCGVRTTAHGLDVQDIRDLPADRVTLYALDPKKPPVGFASHAKRKLVGTFTIDANQKDEIVVKLQPAAVVTARLLDDAGGFPLADTVVVGYIHPDDKTSVSGSFYGKSDKDGKVRVEVIPTGVPVTGQVQHPTGRGYKILPVFEKLTLKPGETRDLGEVRLGLNDE